MQIKLFPPLKDIFITQEFGANYLDFYKQWGLKGHNGIDFLAKDGCSFFFAHDGLVTFAETYDDGGGLPMKHVEVWNDEMNIKTIYLHLKEYKVKRGDRVKAGDRGGCCDNTGKYTTGSHLHFGFKKVNFVGETLDKDNGYLGALDPAPCFPRDWDRSNAYKRYGRPRNWTSFLIEKKVARELSKYLGRTPTPDEINACVYGGWDREVFKNPALAYNWKYLKKSEFLEGKQPFA